MHEKNLIINMIEQQIRPWDVLDEAVLNLYRKVARADFVADPTMRDLAYADIALPIRHGQQMLEPKLEARMLQTLMLRGDENVLHIGSGSGLFAALLSHLAAKVVTVEIIPELAEAAAVRLAAFANVRLLTADGARGIAEEGEFDAVVMTGSTPVIAPELWKNIKTGGKLLALEGVAPAVVLSLIHRKEDDIFIREDILETYVPPLTNAPAALQFSF